MLVTVLPALAAAGNYPLALAVVFVDGVAVGCLNVAMNARGAALEEHYGRGAMAQLHAMFGGGAFAGALLASTSLSKCLRARREGAHDRL